MRSNPRSNLTRGALNQLWVDLVCREGASWGRVVSGSMAPAIRAGDEVLVERAGTSQIRFGDIVVFWRNGKLVTHRALGKRIIGGQYLFLEKGDALLFSSLVPAADIVGKVIAIKRRGRARQVVGGVGRGLQVWLGLISLASLRLWLALRRPQRAKRRRYYGAAFNRSIHLVQRIAVRLFM